MNYKIAGTGSAFPEHSVTNDDLSKFLDTNDNWISTRTGIKSRHICTTETITDLALKAGKEALENAGASVKDLDLIICSTMCGDYLCPSLACLVQKEIGAECPAFDINAACSGFIYALDVAAGYFERNRVKKVLVISAEVMTRLSDWNDRRTCVLFGDGAGAVLLESGEALLSIKITARGDETILNIPNKKEETPFSDLKGDHPFLHMNGTEVYKFAVSSMCNDLRDVIQEAGLKPENIDYILPHQANLRIIDAAKKHLNIASEHFCMNIDHFGNTSSAGIPLLLDEMNRQGKFKSGDILAFSAFGGGLTTGACVVRWTK